MNRGGEVITLQTIQVSSCVSVHGELVGVMGNGDMIVRNGGRVYRGRPLGAMSLHQRRPAEIEPPLTLPSFRPKR
jgi:hypothetical protein